MFIEIAFEGGHHLLHDFRHLFDNLLFHKVWY
jgi:hypothetical protein